MAASSRAQIASSFTVVKGALVDETYAAFRAWDLDASPRVNLDRLEEAGSVIQATSATWLRDVTKVLHRRFDPAGRDRPLVVLAQRGLPLDEWKPLLLWHMTRDELLLRDFLVHWLFPQFDAGAYRLDVDAVVDHVRTVTERGGIIEHPWAESTARRVALGLLKMAVDFGLLRGSVVRHFAPFHLPERSFLYLLHAIRAATGSAAATLASPDWRMFLLRPGDVEREVLRLHQFRHLHYEVAGSLIELSLPCSSPEEWAERMVA